MAWWMRAVDGVKKLLDRLMKPPYVRLDACQWIRRGEFDTSAIERLRLLHGKECGINDSRGIYQAEGGD